VRGGNGTREVGADDDAVKVADHQQGRVGQRVAVEQELIVGRVEILVFALVFPAEKAFFPHVREAVAAAVLGDAFLETVVLPVGSASAGVGCPTKWQRSRKCSWAADLSLSPTCFHLAMNCAAVIMRTV